MTEVTRWLTQPYTHCTPAQVQTREKRRKLPSPPHWFLDNQIFGITQEKFAEMPEKEKIVWCALNAIMNHRFGAIGKSGRKKSEKEEIE